MSREAFIKAARSTIGFPYRWGANGPAAFDCSGLILYCLRAAGFDLPDMTARQLASRVLDKKISTFEALPGDLFFYGKPVISHVMACLHRWPDGHLVLVGARGGDSRTTDYEIAYRNGAMVDIVPGNYWSTGFVFAANPF